MAIFKKRLDRSMEIMKERNRKYLEEYEEQHKSEEEKEKEETSAQMGQNYVFRTDSYRDPGDGDAQQEEVEFEKGDLFAIIVSALMVFWPIFLFFGIVLFFAFRFLMG